MEHVFGSIFQLSEAQQTKLTEWQQSLPRSKAVDGAQCEYHFTVSKDEVVVTVQCHITNKKLNLGKILPTDSEPSTVDFPRLFSRASFMTDEQQDAFDALLKVFPDAKRTYSFLPTALGVVSTFSIDMTNYKSW
jgi:hypothetical protein